MPNKTPLQQATENLRARLNEHEQYLKTGKTNLPIDDGNDRPSMTVRVRDLPLVPSTTLKSSQSR